MSSMLNELQPFKICELNQFVLPGTFKVDISNTKKLLEGERGERIREKGIIVWTFVHHGSFCFGTFALSISCDFTATLILQVVGESGLFTPADIGYVQEVGVKAVSFFSNLEIHNEKCI